MKESMWDANISQARADLASKKGQNQSEQDFLSQINKITEEVEGATVGEAGAEAKGVSVKLPQSKNACEEVKSALTSCFDAYKVN